MHADVDEQAKKEIKEVLVKYDRTLLVADPRRCEPKKCARPHPSLFPASAVLVPRSYWTAFGVTAAI